jgi:hypothetical protein
MFKPFLEELWMKAVLKELRERTEHKGCGGSQVTMNHIPPTEKRRHLKGLLGD